MPNTQDALVARAVLRDIRHTPQKARRVVDLVRGMRADEALNVLKFAPQAAGSDVYTLLNSAIANAKQQNPAIRDASSIALVGCGDEKADDSKAVQTYSQCLETEAAKLLDETGSNLDYANEMAAKACANLQ